MDHSNLLVKSIYISEFEVKFYIKNFKTIIPYLYLANNYNLYYLIITNETKEDICSIKNILINNKKNPEFNKINLFLVCSTEAQKEWCLEYEIQYILDDIDISFNDYEPKILNEPPSWVFQKHARFVNYYNDEKIRIIHLEGLEHNWNILHLLKNNTYTLISWPCYFHKWLYELTVNTLFTVNKEYNKKNIIFLSPDLDCILWSYEYGYNSILANQNCLLDYNIFSIKNTDEIIYNMVMNCRPELWKRPNLAEKVNNLAYIKGAFFGNDKYDYSKLNCKYVNEERISCEEVNKIYNESYCAGIFSESEGACYSSSEYLLSGLPVISTFSKGGRDTWYTKENSIMVEADEDSVSNAVDICIKKIQNGEFSRENIRNKHIEMSSIMRKNIIQCTQQIFDLHNINIHAFEHWNNNYFHKFIHTVDITEIIKIL
jgi:glycosyltransferase involved in cell wall biosynthesis